MEIIKKYVVYELYELLGNKDAKVLKEVDFGSWKIDNSFDSEDEAIQCLIENDKIYSDYVILKEVFIRK